MLFYIENATKVLSLQLGIHTANMGVLRAFNLSTGKKTAMAHDKAVIQYVQIKPHGAVQAFTSNHLKPEWKVGDRALELKYILCKIKCIEENFQLLIFKW